MDGGAGGEAHSTLRRNPSRSRRVPDPTMSLLAQKRPLGATGLHVSALGFGASPLGGVFAPIDEDEGVRAVRMAIDLGIDFFDVAPLYGLTRAETVLGRGLDGIPRERYVLATKVGRYGNNDFDFSAARTRSSVEQSLLRLGVEHVDLLQCHDLEFAPLAIILDETLPELERLRAQGKCRFIGITGLPLGIFPSVLERTSARVDVALSYCHFCLNDTSLERLLPYLATKGIGVINASPLAMGLLSDAGPPAWHPAGEDIRAACARAAAYCRERGQDIAELALRFAVARPGISTTLVGMATCAEVRRNLAALRTPADPRLLDEVRAILAPVHDRGWASGRPEYADASTPRAPADWAAP